MRKMMLAFGLVVSLAGTISRADPVNLANLIQEQSSLTIGDKIFADFVWFGGVHPATDYTLDVSKDPSGVYFLTIHADPSMQMTSGGGLLGYTVSTTSGKPLIVGIDQRLEPGGATVTAAETVLAGGLSGSLIGVSLVESADLTDPPADFGDILEFSAQDKIGVFTLISATSTDTQVAPFTLVQSFHQAPGVPDGGVTALLLGSTLCGLAIARRKNSR